MPRDNILVKIYGQLQPMPEQALKAARDILSPLLGAEALEEALELDGDALLLNYEGVFFPLEEFLEVVQAHTQPRTEGKFHYIDLDAWEVERLDFTAGRLQARAGSRRSLNDVLEYARK